MNADWLLSIAYPEYYTYVNFSCLQLIVHMSLLSMTLTTMSCIFYVANTMNCWIEEKARKFMKGDLFIFLRDCHINAPKFHVTSV